MKHAPYRRKAAAHLRTHLRAKRAIAHGDTSEATEVLAFQSFGLYLSHSNNIPR